MTSKTVAGEASISISRSIFPYSIGGPPTRNSRLRVSLLDYGRKRNQQLRVTASSMLDAIVRGSQPQFESVQLMPERLRRRLQMSRQRSPSTGLADQCITVLAGTICAWNAKTSRL
jgi:hypothetical protein